MNPNTPDTRQWLADYMSINRAATTQRIYDDYEEAFAVTNHTSISTGHGREVGWHNRIRQAVRRLKAEGIIRSVKTGLWMVN